jgi:hypothetical protein
MKKNCTKLSVKKFPTFLHFSPGLEGALEFLHIYVNRELTSNKTGLLQSSSVKKTSQILFKQIQLLSFFLLSLPRCV